MQLSVFPQDGIIQFKGFIFPFFMGHSPDKPSHKSTLPRIFDRNPELKKKVEAYLETIPAEQKEEDFQKFLKFVSGEVTWAEIKNYPKTLLKELAKIGYDKFLRGDYQTAEILFKGLSIIDHTNWYYRAALGSLYQKQKLYDQAIEEYNVSLMLNETEMTSLTNRGECYLHLNNQVKARKDFEKVVALDKEQKNAWARRAKILLDRMKPNKGMDQKESS